MKILVVGDGAKEHALLWKLRRDLPKAVLYCAPGNAGIAKLAHCVPIAVTQTVELLQFADFQKIDLTVISDEYAVINGAVDAFQNQGLATIGPTEKTAQIINNKIYTKYLLDKYKIPAPRYRDFKYYRHAAEYIKQYDCPIVIKSDRFHKLGNTFITDTLEEAHYFLKKFLMGEKAKLEPEKIIIEEFLVGQEIAVPFFTDGISFKIITTISPYKSIFDGEIGAITEGMGAHAPATIRDQDRILERIRNEIIGPIVKGLTLEGIPFRGLMQVGIILTFEGPKVISLKPFFPDPATQTIMPLLESNLFELLIACQNADLEQLDLRLKCGHAANIVICSSGYPGQYRVGKQIIGLDAIVNEKITVFHYGTQMHKGKYYTANGRVLSIVSVDTTLEQSRDEVYRAVKQVTFDGAYYRRDIAIRTSKR
ncbi:phosphoribosylamine--glycine ligase [candidate division KSB1 bacterium]|nr:phosphoribosylamine--glycine ligase [candidate division KSB1 bacterium]